ncbi:MAG: hypothetical protein FWH26_01780 [Oscillospiraceae bacterium]|nr:hypothetical protein [Oscillospiraceae bacterium]
MQLEVAVIDAFALDNSRAYDILGVEDMLGSYSRGEFDAEVYIEENTALQKALIEPMGAATLKVAERIADPSSEEFPVARAVMGGGAGALRAGSGCDCGTGVLLSMLSSCSSTKLKSIEIRQGNVTRTRQFPVHIYTNTGATKTLELKPDPDDIELSHATWKVGSSTTTGLTRAIVGSSQSVGVKEIEVTADDGKTSKESTARLVVMKRYDTGRKGYPIRTVTLYKGPGEDYEESKTKKQVSTSDALTIWSESGSWYYVSHVNNSEEWSFIKKSDVRNIELINPTTGAADLQAYLTANGLSVSTPSNSKISVSVSSNTITITTGFNFTVISGENVSWSNTIGSPAKSYQTLFLDGINQWKYTSYSVFGYNVTVNVNTNGANKLEIKLRKGPSSCYGMLGPVTTQPGDSGIELSGGHIAMSTITSGGVTWGQPGFKNAAAHEFGHLLGLTHPNPNTVSNNVSIMYNGGLIRPKNVDIEKVVMAYATGAYWLFT